MASIRGRGIYSLPLLEDANPTEEDISLYILPAAARYIMGQIGSFRCKEYFSVIRRKFTPHLDPIPDRTLNQAKVGQKTIEAVLGQIVKEWSA